MPGLNLFMVFLEPLNRSNYQYMVTGSIASIIYGEPRLTHDVDLILDLPSKDVSKFISLYPLDKFYCPPEDIIKNEIARETRGHFNIIHHESGFKADIYPIGEDKLHKWAMARRHKVNVENSDIWLAPPEYVIIRKLEYYREGQSPKHLRDIKRILEYSADLIDDSVLKEKISEHNLLLQWRKLQS